MNCLPNVKFVELKATHFHSTPKAMTLVGKANVMLIPVSDIICV